VCNVGVMRCDAVCVMCVCAMCVCDVCVCVMMYDMVRVMMCVCV